MPKSKTSIDLTGSDSETSADATIIEDDEELDDENHDSFVDMLVEKHEELRQKLYAAELRCATIEAEVRKEMVDEMEQRLLEMQEFYNNRMMNDAEQNAQLTNRKIDILVSTQARNEPELVAQSNVEQQFSDMSMSDDDHYESGHDEAEVEGALVARRGGKDRSLSEASGEESSVFDDATEGEVSLSVVIGDSSEDEQASNDDDNDDESAILRPGRTPRRAASQGKNYAASEDSFSEAGGDASELASDSGAASACEDDRDEDGDENMSSAISAAGDDESDADYGSDGNDDSDAEAEDDPDGSRRAAERGEIQAFVEIPSSLPDGSLDSIASSPAAKDSDSSFDDGSAFSDSDEEKATRPARPPQRRSGRTSNANASGRGSNGSTATTRTRRSSNKPRNSVIDMAGQLTDLSDASMVVEETTTPKKKRKLRKKAAVQEDDWVEQIGDSSLVEAVYSNSARASGASRASRSFTSRKSGRQ